MSMPENRSGAPLVVNGGLAEELGPSLNSGAATPAREGESTKLKRGITLPNGCGIIIGIIIGSGIFISPKGVLMETRSVGMSMIVWLGCGIFSTIGALCYAELGTSILKSGGDYAYIMEAFGEVPAFLFLWASLIIVNPASNAIIALTFSEYFHAPIFPHCDFPFNSQMLVATLVILILTFVNCYNVKWATRIQDAMAVTKVIALIIIIGVGCVSLFMGNTGNFQDAWLGTVWDPSKITLAFYSGIFSYSGWNYLNFVSEEMKDPFKNLPRAIYISLPTVTAIYLLANVAYFVALDPEELLDSDAVAVSFAKKLMGPASILIPIFVACSTMGSLNGILLASSRMFFVGARDGQLPELLSMINVKYYTPMPSLLFVSLVSCIMLFSGGVFELINYAIFAESLLIAFSIAALLWLRYKRPNMPRPIKLHISIPIFFFILCILVILVPFISADIESIKSLFMSLAIMLIGVPLYFFGVKWKNKPAVFQKAWIGFTHFVQKVLYCVPQSPDKIE